AEVPFGVERRHHDADGGHTVSVVGQPFRAVSEAGLKACATPEAGLKACATPEAGLKACATPEAGVKACATPEAGMNACVARGDSSIASYSAFAQRSVAVPGSWNRSAATARRVSDFAIGFTIACCTASTVSSTPCVDSETSASKFT